MGAYKIMIRQIKKSFITFCIVVYIVIMMYDYHMYTVTHRLGNTALEIYRQDIVHAGSLALMTSTPHICTFLP